MREDVSYLKSQGHITANRYPLAMVWSEIETVRRRVREEEAFRIGNDKMVQVAVHGGKKGQTLFNRHMKELNDGGST